MDTSPLPQIVIYLDACGSIRAEAIINGAREKIALDGGDAETAMWQIRTSLAKQRDAITARQQRQRERDDEVSAERHRYVFRKAVERHGIAFAERTIGGSVPVELRNRSTPAKSTANQEPRVITVIDSLELL